MRIPAMATINKDVLYVGRIRANLSRNSKDVMWLGITRFYCSEQSYSMVWNNRGILRLETVMIYHDSNKSTCIPQLATCSAQTAVGLSQCFLNVTVCVTNPRVSLCRVRVMCLFRVLPHRSLQTKWDASRSSGLHIKYND